MFGLDAGQIQPSEPTTEKYPGAEDRLLMIWDELSKEAIRKSVVSFRKRLRACINAKGELFEYKL